MDPPPRRRSKTSPDARALHSETQASHAGLKRDASAASLHAAGTLTSLNDGINVDKETTTFPVRPSEIDKRIQMYRQELERETKVLEGLQRMQSLYLTEEERNKQGKQVETLSKLKRVQPEGNRVNPEDFLAIPVIQGNTSKMAMGAAMDGGGRERSRSMGNLALPNASAAPHVASSETMRPSNSASSLPSRSHSRQTSSNGGSLFSGGTRPRPVLDEIHDRVVLSQARLRAFEELLQHIQAHRSRLFLADDPVSEDRMSQLDRINTELVQNTIRKDVNAEFVLLERLGKGQYGEVYKAKQRSNGMVVALKRCRVNIETSAQFLRELAILRDLRTPYCTRMFGCYFSGEEKVLSIVMEYCEGGSLGDYVSRYPMTDAQIAAVCLQVVHGLDFLHSHSVIHRDLKAGNMLLCRRGRVKLGDFGLAKVLNGSSEQRGSTHSTTSIKGSPYWMSPEAITKPSSVTTKTDIWSLGITVLEMAECQPPHFDCLPATALYKIVHEPAPTFRNHHSLPAVDFLAKCLQKDPVYRPSAQDLVRHSFVQQAHSGNGVGTPALQAIYDMIELRHQYAQHTRSNSAPVTQFLRSPEGWKDREQVPQRKYSRGEVADGTSAGRQGTAGQQKSLHKFGT